MKKAPWAIALILLVSAGLLSSCKKEGDEIAVRIDDEKISINQFNTYYYMFAKMMFNMDKKEVDKMAANPEIENHPTLNLLNKTKFMDFLVSRKLLANKAKEDDSINKKDLETIAELAKLHYISSYFLSQKLKDEIKVSDDEVNAFYAKNKEQFKGVPMNDEAINWIKQRVFMEKMEVKSNAYILDLLAEARVSREGFKKWLAKHDKDKPSKEDKEEKKEEPKTKKKK